MTQHIEKGTNYAYTVERMKEINFRSLRSVSVEFTKRLPVELSSELYTNIQHGVCQLQSEPELNMYIHALGLMHEAKLQYAFEHLSDDFINHQTIDIIDYGCGQAVGTICYADFLHKNGFSQQVRRVVLIEPSEIALKRAALHASCFFPQAEIITCLKGFDDLEEDDLCVDEEIPTLHILSNVIDLADDYFDLERFVGLINQCSIGDNHYLCIEPHFDYEEKDERLERFVDLLDAEAYFNKTFLKGMFVEGRDWTCQVTLCKNNQDSSSVEMPIPISEGTFKTRIKELISNGAEYVSGSKIEDVACSINDNIVIVHISLEEPLKGYVLGNDGVSYRIGQNNKVVTSLNAIIKVLIEDEELAPFSNFVFENPQILSRLLKGAVVDILQQEVPKGKEYDNLFSANKLTNTSNRNVIINNCVRFKLSGSGEKIADKIANILLGFIDDDSSPILMEIANKADEEKQYKKAFEFYKLAAEANNFEAIYRLGTYYYYGKGVTQDYSESVKCYRRAAEQGDALAQCDLGYCLDTGKGITQNLAEALEWYRKAAEQGNATAQYNIGVCYEKGRGVGKDEAEAVKWYYKAAKQGYANAQCSLGICYDLGRGVNKDEIEAVRWYRKAADQGDMIAQTNLGVCYKFGQGVLKDEVEAVKWYRKAAEQGFANAQYKLACCYKDGTGVVKNDGEAIKWFIKAAEQGNETAESQLVSVSKGAIKLLGINEGPPLYGHGPKIEIKANEINWLIKVAKCGYVKAQNRLALYYRTKKDYPEAVRWYYEAAKQGDVDAQINLAYCYKVGQGVNKNISETARWYYKAATQGNAYAQYELACCYKQGEGVEQNDNEAIEWYIKAANQGEQNAINVLLLKRNSLFERKYVLDEIGIDWLTKVAEKGFAQAQYELGIIYERKQSFNDAAKWYLKSAKQDNDPAKCRLVDLYALGMGVEKSTKEALEWLDKCNWEGECIRECDEYYILRDYFIFTLNKEEDRRGAKLYSLGSLFYNGKTTAQSYEEAIKWWKFAIEANNSEAAYMLGVCYEKGYGVEQSYEQAFKWFLRAAEQGYGKARFSLGVCYENGEGIGQSYTEAIKWYSKASEQGNKDAMCYLGNCYRNGRGVERSYENAVKWYKASDTKEAQKALDEIYSNNLLRRWFKIVQFRFGSLK